MGIPATGRLPDPTLELEGTVWYIPPCTGPSDRIIPYSHTCTMDRHGTVWCIPSCTRDWSLIPYLQITNCQHQQKLPPSVPAPPPVVDLPCSLEKRESIHMYTARHITHAHKGPAYIPTVHASQKISPVHAQSSDITFLYPYHPPTITHQLHSLVLDPPPSVRMTRTGYKELTALL